MVSPIEIHSFQGYVFNHAEHDCVHLPERNSVVKFSTLYRNEIFVKKMAKIVYQQQ